MATKDDSDIPESGAVFTFGKSKFADNLPNKFWVKNDKVLQIACGDEHTALITESGRVFMFGPNDWGQLGLGNDNKVANKPSCIKSLKHDKSRLVACGRSHTIISTVSGHVYSCGSNSEGQLGIKDISDLSTPKRIESLPEEEFKMLDAGADCSVALTEDGRVYVWGGNEDGKLGLGKVETAEEPVLLAMERPAVSVACGYYHTAIVTDDGKLYTMGESEGGKLGLPEDLEPTNVPQHVSDIEEPIKWVACGSSHTVALTQSGDVYVFGDGESGQLGLGTDVLSCSKPTLLKLPFKVSHVFCGQSFTACISEKGQLYTFGDGRHGKLAHGSDVFSNQFKPFHSKRFTKFLVDKVACGGCHMIVTARPKALNGVEEDGKEDIDEMKKTLVSQPVESSGSPSLTRTLSARERRRDEVSRSFSTELNQTLPPLGQSRILPSLSATMPALKSSPKPVKEDKIENGFVPQLQNGKLSDADSGRDDTEDEDHLQGKHKKESLKPPVSPRRALSPRSSSSDSKPGSLPPVKEENKDDGSNKSNGSGSEGDTENEEDETDGAERKKKKKNGKKRKTSKIEEGSIKEEKEEDSWNDDDDEDESDDNEGKENKAVKELESALVEKDGSKSDDDKESNVDSEKGDGLEEKQEVEDKDEEEKSEKEIDKDSRGPVPIPRKQKTDESEDNDEEEEEEEEEKKKDSQIDLQQESDKDKEDEKEESEKESKVEEVISSDKEDEKKNKKDKKDKDKKKKKEKDEEDVKEKDDDEEEEEKEDSKKKGKDKKKDKKDKKKEKEKDKKKKKGKDEDEEEEKEDEEEEDEKEKSDKKSKDKKKDKKDKKKGKDKGDKEDEEEDEEEADEDEKEDKKNKDKDKKEKEKKKKGKDDEKEKDENGNTEKPPPKKSRTCNIL